MQHLPPPRTRAILSVPRLGWNDAWGCFNEILSVHKIPLSFGTGAWFDHTMERLLENAIADGFDQVLALDYDTLANAMHVAMLLELAARPGVDAVFPLQAKRGSAEIIAMRDPPPDQNELAWMLQQDLVPVHGGHFGATIIKLDRLKRVPKPWFQHVPGKDGGWNGTQTDADVNFWLKWRAAGNSLYLAPKVRVGHLQLVNTVPMADGTFAMQFVKQFNQGGFPPGTFD